MQAQKGLHRHGRRCRWNVLIHADMMRLRIYDRQEKGVDATCRAGSASLVRTNRLAAQALGRYTPTSPPQWNFDTLLQLCIKWEVPNVLRLSEFQFNATAVINIANLL
jgi:hypothetical protein